MLSNKDINKKIKSAFWDYNIDPGVIYLIAVGKKEGTGFFDRGKILARLTERLSWYELIDVFGKEFLIKNLTRSVISKIRNPEIRKRYESIRQILRGEAISNAGWNNRNRRRLKASLLSDRWDRP